MPIIESQNETVKIETGKINVFVSANEYSPSLPISYFRTALVDVFENYFGTHGPLACLAAALGPLAWSTSPNPT